MVTESLREAVETSFGGLAGAALPVPTSYGGSPQDREIDRVRCDILISGKGDFDQFRYTELANQAHRDVLMLAEYPPDDDDPRTYGALRAQIGLRGVDLVGVGRGRNDLDTTGPRG